MINLRKYGKPPFRVAVLHGGPGAAGEMMPLARRLSLKGGVLEPFQSSTSIEGQVDELKTILNVHAEIPVTLVGFSWGAMLGYIFCAGYQGLVKKLIMIGSGPFEDKYAAGIMETRLSRLSISEREEVKSLITIIENDDNKGKDGVMKRFGKLMEKADSFDSVVEQEVRIKIRYDIYKSVWPQASKMRKSGTLLELGKKIQCPVIAIHGNYDPHPAEGVKIPLNNILNNFQFIMLENCGHRPWTEKKAQEKFYKILIDML